MARILVADDDAEVVSLIREFLQGLGHEVRCEPDGLAAGIRARQWLPDLIISDIQMPHFLGTTAVVGLQQSAATAAIPVIFISAAAIWLTWLRSSARPFIYLTRPPSGPSAEGTPGRWRPLTRTAWPSMPARLSSILPWPR